MNEILKDLSPIEYHRMGSSPKKDPANAVVSKSLLWKFFPNPRKWLESPPFVSTPAMRWGSLVDCLALTPQLFDSTYYVGEFPTGRHLEIVDALLSGLPIAISPYPEFRSKEAREWRSTAQIEGKMVAKPDEVILAKKHAKVLERDLTIISASEHFAALNAARKLIEHPITGPALEVGEKQVAAVCEFVEPVTGVNLKAKCLLDHVDFDTRRIIDLKTTSIPISSQRSLENHCYEFGYHVQLAWYSAILEVVTGEPWEDYAIVFQEKAMPYYTTPPVPINPDAIALGRRWIAGALTRWAECAVLGDWDAYDPGSELGTLDVPRYAYDRETFSN